MRTATYRYLVIPAGLVAGWALLAAEPDLSEYRTVEKAVPAEVRKVKPGQEGLTGYLGASVQRDVQGRLVVEEVQSESPAAKAGLKKGDVLIHLDGRPVRTAEGFREWLQAHAPGETVKIGLQVGDNTAELTATLTAASRPMKPSAQRAFLGIELGEPKEGEGVRVERVVASSPAETAGVKSGDYLSKLEGIDITRAARLTDLLMEKRPGDMLLFAVMRDGKEVPMKVTLATDRGQGGNRGARGERGGPGGGGTRGGRGGGFDTGAPTTLWKARVFRLAVVPIEFTDIKHNDKVPVREWEQALFSRNVYAEKDNATGQAVHGSLNDYCHEQSGGALRLEGKVFDWVQVKDKRGDYQKGTGTSNKTALPAEALEKVATRDGKEALRDFDGFLFIYAGQRMQTNSGALYYPHAGSIGFQSRRSPYLLTAEGGSRMTPIGGLAKIFGRTLGLPDLAATPGNVGSEGLGVWCAMSGPQETTRPQHYCPWAKEKLGWIKPTVLDPSVKQKLILGPIEDSPTECFKVLVRPDGSEYLLLENRRRKGFDTDLPGEGLLIWRVVNDRPILEESHGIEGPQGPTTHLSAVPFPSSASSAFTPDTIPSSRSPLGGGLPIHITDIRRLPDGRVAFHIGYEYR